MKTNKAIYLSTVSLFIFLNSCQSLTIASKTQENNSTYFSYKNSRIWYEDRGEGDVMLLIHGFASSSYTWRYIKKHYSTTHRVICIDLKGFGESSKPRDDRYMLEDQSDIVKEFIKYKSLNNITLVGHSFGGAVALSSYIESDLGLKKSINNIILINSAAYKQEMPGYISLLRTPLINSIALNLIPTTVNSERILKELVYNDDVVSREMIETYGNFLATDDSKYALMKAASNIIPDNIDSLSAKYKEIEVPVLIIWGDNDTVIKKSVGDRLHKNIAKSSFTSFKNCGHMPHVEYPEKTIAVIDDFLLIN